MCSAVALSARQMQYLLEAVCHKDVRAVKDSAIVLSADKVETLDAEPTALVPEKIQKNKLLMLHRESKCNQLSDLIESNFLFVRISHLFH